MFCARMSRLPTILLAVFCAALVRLPAQVAPAPTPDANALKWDAESKDYNAQPGEESAPFTFTATNTSNAEISISRLSTSCGCTVAQLPSTPYKLGPGSNVSINVSLDLRGKSGTVAKTVSVDSSVGFKSLLVRANIPAPQPAANASFPVTAKDNRMGDRAKNIQTALADRQAVFKGDCAKCHVDPGIGKMGKELYHASCAICHDPESGHGGHRAAMVPDLKVAKAHRDLNYWQKWVMEGKAGTLMPAFAQAHGGPLTQEQIDSLVTYLYEAFPRAPQAQAAVTTPPVSVPPAPPAPVAAPAAVPQKN
jgi:mono/diheme cytochrome c family protein